ncbi:MAG TPA: DUF429 domain-containing protein [Chloroflexota bacterium]
MTLVGVDGCRGGWLVAEADEGLHQVSFRLCRSFPEVLAPLDERSAVLCVDMPIGLVAGGPRRCDVEARAFLGRPRGSSVFPAPCRAALEGRDHRQASELNWHASGNRLTIQGYGILARIREVDEHITADRQRWLREAHPEVGFALLSGGGRGLTYRKKTPLGEAERLATLPEPLGCIDVAATRACVGASAVGRDDLLDALACLATAQRIVLGSARVFPAGPPQIDQRGLRMEIVA